MASGGTAVALREVERVSRDAPVVHARAWECFRRMVVAEAARIAADRPPNVLEYGSGAGTDASMALAAAGIASIGVDVAGPGIRAARERAERISSGVRPLYLAMDPEDLEFGDGVFDVVCGVAILYRLDPERALAEVVRVLRPGGTAFFVEPRRRAALDAAERSFGSAEVRLFRPLLRRGGCSVVLRLAQPLLVEP